MRSILFIICVLAGSFVQSQTLSKSKISSYLISQNVEDLKLTLKSQGFEFYDKKESNQMTVYNFHKKNQSGVEAVSISYNDELFCIMYKPLKDYYPTFKEIFLTDNYKYAYSFQTNNYYESKYNDIHRIGFDDKNGIISLFVNLK